MKTIYASTVVWGDAFVGLLLDYALPSLFASGNLPALAAQFRLRFLIYTTRRDYERINAFVYQHYATFASVAFDYVLIDESWTISDHKYELMGSCHRHMIVRAYREDAGIMFLMPDTIYADGAYGALAPMIAEGRRAILMQGISTVGETFLPALGTAPEVRREPSVLSIAPRPLMRLVIRHPHPITESQYLDAPGFTSHPSFMRWRLGARGCLAHCWHLFPLFIHPRRQADAFLTTIDGDFVSRAVAAPDDCHIVTNSDDFLMVEVSSRDKRDFITDRPAEMKRIVRWIGPNTDILNRGFVRTPLVFHDGADSGLIEAVRNRAAALVGESLDWYDRLRASGSAC